MHRSHVNKSKSAKKFNGRASKTNPINLRGSIRGGIRL